MLYLAWFEDHEVSGETAGPWRALFPLAPGLAFVASEQHRSAVYHALKDALPAGSALLVDELREVPKCKGLAPGALAWARRQTLTS